MKRHMRAGGPAVIIILVLVVVFALWWLLGAVRGIQAGSASQGVHQLEQALWRAAVVCYTTEGSYPADVDYLVDHYGIQIDESKYIVHYQAYGQNLMPDITVLEAGDAG